MMATERPDSEMMAIARSIQHAHEQGPMALLARARDRGDLRPGVDPALVADIIMAACERFVLRPAGMDMDLLTRILDVVLFGGLTDSSPRPRTAHRPSPRAARAGRGGSAPGGRP